MAEGLPRTLVAGGGIAGLEALMALADLAGERTALELISPDPDFALKPMVVEEPFSSQPAEHRELEPLVAELGATLVRGKLLAVDPERREVELAGGERRGYERLVVCIGGRTRAALKAAETFRVAGERLDVDGLLRRAESDPSRRLAVVVPPGGSWPLPAYELALMLRRRAEESGRADLAISLYTPEQGPLAMFGRTASEAVAELLGARRIDFHGAANVHDAPGGGLVATPGDRPVEAGAVLAMPVIEGPAIAGLPRDEHGFLPVDEHSRVRGVERVYAAGDGTNFPVKHGGVGTQQADAAAEQIAAELGAEIEPSPFHPVLRGQLIAGAESLNLRHDVTGGHGEGVASPDYLWWPPQKVSGRYLAAWLAHERPHAADAPPTHPIDVEVSLPREWHEQPMAVDPLAPPEVE